MVTSKFAEVLAVSMVGLAFAALFGTSIGCLPNAVTKTPSAPLVSDQELLGCRFANEQAAAPLESIVTESIPLPDFPGWSAIWGATGRDRTGNIWFGVSGCEVDPPSAHVLEYDPATKSLHDRGNVISELRRLGILREGERQLKIHSKFVHGEDGHLYFASMDEEGENTDGSKLPTWGSHLWRLRLPEYRWEHLLTAPEALIAVATSGRYIYALGYFGHVVYQFDCQTEKTRSVTVGSEGGHISRNFFCDLEGHVYVPRLRRGDDKELAVTLVELDQDLKEVGQTPLKNYTLTADDASHGITGVQPLADRSIAFITDQGYLYLVEPATGKPAQVRELGWFHPEGKVYMASLFTDDGKRHLMGATSRSTSAGNVWEWLTYDVAAKKSTACDLPLPTRDGKPIPNPLLYGCISRDNQGGCYLAGVFHQEKDFPLVLRVASSKVAE